MRVLLDYRPALRDRSGAGEYTHQLVKALLNLERSDADPRLELTIFSSSWKDRLVVTPELQGARVVDRRISVHLLNLIWHRLEWPSVEALTGGTFDVAHSSHPLLMPARRAAQIVTIHDLHFLAHPERTRAEVRRDYPALIRDHVNRAARVVVPSRFTAGEVERQLGVGAERIAVCPPGAPEWAAIPEPAADGYLLFFGTLEPRKNVGGLLDAYERLITSSGAGGVPRLPELVLAGKATADARPWLDRLVRAPLAGRVRHVGYVDPANRLALYGGARMLVMPSFEEGFGLPALEAMKLGVPVVASARGSLPEVVGDAGALVNPDDPVEIAWAIARLLDDEGYRAACAARGRARARQFSWADTARKVHEVYRGAIAARRPRS